jgi:hypothetical protein
MRLCLLLIAGCAMSSDVIAQELTRSLPERELLLVKTSAIYDVSTGNGEARLLVPPKIVEEVRRIAGEWVPPEAGSRFSIDNRGNVGIFFTEQKLPAIADGNPYQFEIDRREPANFRNGSTVAFMASYYAKDKPTIYVHAHTVIQRHASGKWRVSTTWLGPISRLRAVDVRE